MASSHERFFTEWGSNLQRWGTCDLKSATLTTGPR
jgi:hypothetical protein